MQILPKRRIPFYQSIKFYMVLLVLLAVIPYGIIIIYSALEQRDAKAAEIRNQSRSIVLTIASQQEALISGAEQLLETLSKVQCVREKNVPASTEMFKTLLKGNDKYTTILLVDSDGTVIASALPFTSPLSIADRKYFQETILSKKLSIGEYSIGRIASRPIVSTGYPILGEDGRVIGVLVLGLDLGYMRKVFANFITPEEINATILDRRGVTLNRILEPEKYIGRQASSETMSKLSRGPDEGRFQSIGVDGISKEYFYKRMYSGGSTEPYAYVMSTIPEQLTTEQPRQAMLRYIASFGVILIAVLILTVLFAKNKIGDKVKSIVQVIEAFSAGKLEGKATEKVKRGELGLIAEAFDEMHATITSKEEEQRCQEKLLRQSEERYRSLVEDQIELVSRFRSDGTFLFVNKGFCSFFGKSREELLGAKWRPLVHEEDLPGIAAQLASLCPEHPVALIENRVGNADGKLRWVQFANRAFFDENGEISEIQSVGRDITERKEAEELLRESESRAKAMLQAIPDLMFRMDSHGVFLDYKADISDRDAPSEPTIIGKRNRDLTPPECADLIDGKIRATLETDALQTFEYQLPVPGRGTRDYEARMVASGLNEVTAIVRDVTEYKRAEEERRQLEERLLRAEKMEALGTLAGGVAHDLNNVLGIVVGYSELLLEDLDESSSERSQALEILRGGQKAAAIVQDLLTLARRGVSSKKVLNLNNVIMGCRKSPEIANVLSIHENIKLKADYEPDLLNVLGSTVHLEKSFVNLVSNAVEAMPNGGTLTVKTANRYLDKPISGYDEVREGDYVVLSVSDTGEGIPAPDLKRIFEPFYTKKVMGRSGTGLGLAVVWGTMKDHLGYINVESEEGKGTTFTLYFPVTRDDVTPEQLSISASEYMGKGESILVVDDVKEQCNLACTMLRKLKYKVECVSSGEEAVEYLRQNAFDLLVLDMIMDPGMDGLDTYWKILEIRPRQKAIIVSGFSETERVVKAKALGAGAYVKKPYVIEKLGLAVRKELDRPK